MNTTTSTETLPVQIDTALAAASTDEARLAARRYSQIEAIHRMVGDDPGHRYIGRQRIRNPFKLTDAEALAAEAAQPWDAAPLARAKAQVADLDAALEVVHAEIARCNAAFVEAGGWSRFFLVPGGHVHSSRHCSTCNNGIYATQFGWLPHLSGLTEAAAVADQGALLCTVCFPTAPVDWTNGLELAEAAKKAARCSGSGQGYDADKPAELRRHHKWGHCRGCGTVQTVTSTGKIRAHKPA